MNLTRFQLVSCVQVEGTTIVIALKYRRFSVAASKSLDASVNCFYKCVKTFRWLRNRKIVITFSIVLDIPQTRKQCKQSKQLPESGPIIYQSISDKNQWSYCNFMIITVIVDYFILSILSLIQHWLT